MDRNVYQSELDRVRFTEAGKSALTDALMTGRAESEQRRGRGPWMKRGAIAALAAVLLVGTAAAVTVSLWDGFFGGLDPSEQAVVDTLSGDLPGAVSSNGAVMTPQAAFGTDGVFYLMLEIRAPEGTVLPALDGERETYQLFGADILNGEWLELRESDGGDVDFSYSTEPTWLEDDDPTDNVIRVVVSILADGDLEGKVLHIPGLWKQTDAKAYTEIFSGDFDFTLTGGLAEGSLLAVDVTGVTAETPYGPLTLDHLELSPLGLRWGYHYDEDTAQAAWEAESSDGDALITTHDGGAMEFSDMVTPGAELVLVLRDGTRVEMANSFGEYGAGWTEQSGFFTRPVDLAQVAYLLWGETEIPLN